VISHINIAGAIRLPADVTYRKSPREERVRGVGYLDLVHVWMSRVVEGSILLVSRSITSTTAGCKSSSSTGSPTEECSA
jgi:hypothetical protein